MHIDQPNVSVNVMPSATVYSTMFTFGEHANLVISHRFSRANSLWASFSAAFCFFANLLFTYMQIFLLMGMFSLISFFFSHAGFKLLAKQVENLLLFLWPTGELEMFTELRRRNVLMSTLLSTNYIHNQLICNVIVGKHKTAVAQLV